MARSTKGMSRLTRKDGSRKRYVTYEKLFEAIKEYHEESGKHKRNDWSFGLMEVQYSKNSRYHTGIGRSPYKAMFGHDPMMGVETLGLDKEFTNDLDSEEQLEALFPQEALENVASEDSEDDVPNSGKFLLFITKLFCKHFKIFE